LADRGQAPVSLGNLGAIEDVVATVGDVGAREFRSALGALASGVAGRQGIVASAALDFVVGQVGWGEHGKWGDIELF